MQRHFFQYALLVLILFPSFIYCSGNKIVITNLNDGINFLSKKIIADSLYYSDPNISDLSKIDSLYKTAIQAYDYDYSEAMLALTFTTLPYSKMPLKIPVLEIEVDIPLPSVNGKEFETKVKYLPSKYFFDSPDNAFGDKDKMPHFFASAFLSYNISFFNFSKFMGIFVELFEQGFKIQGAVDQRDIVADNLGELFGDVLKNNKNILPSQILSIYSLLYFSCDL